MDRKDLIKKILELSLELKDAEGVQAMMCITDMEKAVKDCEKQLRLHGVGSMFYCNKEVIALDKQCDKQCKDCRKWVKDTF